MKAEHLSMLPGFRFLFVAIVLSTSMLIFGLGAAALLRSAHEEFAHLPNKRAQPEPVFAQPLETTRPTLALLRVDALPEQSSADRPATPNAATLPEQPSPSAAEPDKSAEPDRAAALSAATPSEEKSMSADKSPDKSADQPADRSADQPADRSADQPTDPSAETPVPTETPARADADTAAPPLETQAAANPQPAPSAAIETTAAVSEPLNAPADASAKAAAMKIATLGGPEVVIDPKAASKKPLATAGKRAQTRPRIKRRRIVRPRIVAPKPVTLGFFEPLPVPERQTRQN